MNVLITGANGQLGHCIYDVVKNRDDHFFIFTDICGDFSYYDKLDITDNKAVREYIDEHDINCIINCAAYTNVDQAEIDFQLAKQLNETAPAMLGKMLGENGLFIHVSTDYVFGGIPFNTPINENQETSPIGVYGKTKKDGEDLIKFFKHENVVIVRTAWLYSEYGKNFLKTIKNLLKTKEEIKVVYDQVGSPTYAGDLAETLVYIATHFTDFTYSGTYHYTNEGVCSWYDFAKEISYNVDSKCVINPCLSNEFETKAKRPAYSVLDKAKIKNIFKIQIPYWKDSLQKCIERLNKNT